MSKKAQICTWNLHYLPPQADVIIINHVSLLNPQASSKVYKYSDIYDIHAKNLSRNFKYLHFAEFKDT